MTSLPKQKDDDNNYSCRPEPSETDMNLQAKSEEGDTHEESNDNVHDKCEEQPSRTEHVVNPERPQREERAGWANNCEFLLASMGWSIGYGNLWRFPYLAYKNGGAAFLIPYLLFLIFCGIPLYFMEFAIGQYAGLGPNILFAELSPILSGLGWSMVIISIVCALYFNVLTAWCLYYLFCSFTSVLPWSNCNNDFNSPECYTYEDQSACASNGTYYYNFTCMDVGELCTNIGLIKWNGSYCFNLTTGQEISLSTALGSVISTEDFFNNRLLGVTGTSWENMGEMQWELFGCLILASALVCACLIKGVKSSGKVVYCTVLFPYVVLFIFLVRGLTLSGAYTGLEYYILEPDFSKLTELQVWSDAATQIFYSLGLAFGGCITLASYNKLNNNCMRDAVFIVLLTASTSFLAGLVVFSTLGYMAEQVGVTVDDVSDSGLGLVFVTYPEAITMMPVSAAWSVLFFVMLLTIGIDSQFVLVEVFCTAIVDSFKSLRSKMPLVVTTSCFAMFLLSLPMCLGGGIYIFALLDSCVASVSLFIIGLLELIGVQYIYGSSRFMRNITETMKISISYCLRIYWQISWLIIVPLAMCIMLVMNILYWTDFSYDDYIFPASIQSLGVAIIASFIVPIPIGAIVAAKQNFDQGKKWTALFQASENFGPTPERIAKVMEETPLNPDSTVNYGNR